MLHFICSYIIIHPKYRKALAAQPPRPSWTRSSSPHMTLHKRRTNYWMSQTAQYLTCTPWPGAVRVLTSWDPTAAECPSVDRLPSSTLSRPLFDPVYRYCSRRWCRCCSPHDIHPNTGRDLSNRQAFKSFIDQFTQMQNRGITIIVRKARYKETKLGFFKPDAGI